MKTLISALFAIACILAYISSFRAASHAEKRPDKEFALYPEQEAIALVVKKNALDYNCDRAIFRVITDGYHNEMEVHGNKAEEMLTFKLRTDGLKYTSVQFFDEEKYYKGIFYSAIVLVPDEESLNRWNE